MYGNAVTYGNEGNPNYPRYGIQGVKSVGPRLLARGSLREHQQTGVVLLNNSYQDTKTRFSLRTVYNKKPIITNHLNTTTLISNTLHA